MNPSCSVEVSSSKITFPFAVNTLKLYRIFEKFFGALPLKNSSYWH